MDSLDNYETRSALDPRTGAKTPSAGAPRDAAGRCRTNSRRGSSEPALLSYPPVEAVQRGLEILKTVNRLRIASVTDIHQATGIPKPTIVRMLETLMVEGYVARGNLFGGYRVTSNVRELSAGYSGISMVIEASRAPAIELTQRIKWPIGIGVLDGDAVSIQFWTGAISPFAHRSTALRLRPSLITSAMGRAYMAFCPDEEREELLAALRGGKGEKLDAAKEAEFRALLGRIRANGYAVRDPRTDPKETVTLAMPLCQGDRVLAAISISFYRTTIQPGQIRSRVLAPLRATRAKIEANIALLSGGGSDLALTPEGFGLPPDGAG